MSATPGQGLDWYGSMYTDLGAYHSFHKEKKDAFDFRGITVLNLKFQNANRRFGKVEGDADLYLLHGAYPGTVAPGTSAGFFSALDTLVRFGGGAPLCTDVRKLYLSVYFPFADITLGRQIINFGKGLFFSPIDAFSAVEASDLNLRRRGSDIGMVRFPIGDLSGIDLVAEAPFNGGPHSTALKLYTTLEGWDLSLVGMYRNAGKRKESHDETVLGAAVKGDLIAGITGEAVMRHDNRTGTDRFEGMLGLDYSIGGRLLLAAEYLHNGDGIAESPWGEHNAFGSVRYIASDIMNLSGNVIHDFEHDLTVGTVQYFYNILQNVNMTAYVRGYRGTGLFDAEYALRIEVDF